LRRRRAEDEDARVDVDVDVGATLEIGKGGVTAGSGCALVAMGVDVGNEGGRGGIGGPGCDTISESEPSTAFHQCFWLPADEAAAVNKVEVTVTVATVSGIS